MSSEGPQERNPARRAFAVEYRDATHEERHEDGERAPRYQLLPTGEWANRVFIIGTLADVETKPDNDEYVKGELQDPTGKFTIDAGEFQPGAVANMKEIETPEFVAVTGKAISFPGDRGRVSKIRVEKITDVPPALYDHWVAETAAQVIKRLKNFDNPDNDAAERAAELYGTDLDVYHQSAIEAVEAVREMILEDGTVDEDGPTTTAEADQTVPAEESD